MSKISSIAILIIGTALVFCLAFLRPEQPMAARQYYPLNAGQVLGVNEAAANMGSAALPGRLPESYQPVNAIPRPAGHIRDLAVGDCSAIVMDVDTGTILFAREAARPRPLASITKLMTALVFLDHNPGWETIYTLGAADRLNGGKAHIYIGDQVTVRDLFYLALVASDNTAARALVRSSGLADGDFIEAMNVRAAELGLSHTNFRDYVGFSAANVSTAEEIARLLKTALEQAEISAATRLAAYEFATAQGRQVLAQNTNELLPELAGSGVDFQGGKTGHTEAAGYCFAGAFRNPLGHGIISVVLGGDTPSSRFSLTKKMMQWAYASYVWE